MDWSLQTYGAIRLVISNHAGFIAHHLSSFSYSTKPPNHWRICWKVKTSFILVHVDKNITQNRMWQMAAISDSGLPYNIVRNSNCFKIQLYSWTKLFLYSFFFLYNQTSHSVIANNKSVYLFLVSFQSKNLDRLIANVRNNKMVIWGKTNIVRLQIFLFSFLATHCYSGMSVTPFPYKRIQFKRATSPW